MLQLKWINLTKYSVSRDIKMKRVVQALFLLFILFFHNVKQRQIALLEYCLAERTNEKNVKILMHSVIHIII